MEKNIHYLTQRWWRTARAATMVEAQVLLDRFCVRVGDKRRRPPGRFSPRPAGSSTSTTTTAKPSASTTPAATSDASPTSSPEAVGPVQAVRVDLDGYPYIART